MGVLLNTHTHTHTAVCWILTVFPPSVLIPLKGQRCTKQGAVGNIFKVEQPQVELWCQTPAPDLCGGGDLVT